MFATRKLVAADDWQDRLAARNFDSLWSLTGDAVKAGTSTGVIRCRLGERDVFLKKYRATGANQLLSAITRGALFGRSKVRREFENIQRLRSWGLDAPAPVVYGEHRVAGWLIRSLLISEAIPDATSLDAVIKELWERPSGRDRQLSRAEARFHKNSLIDHLADYIRRLHEHQFVHHDLYWRNILLSGNSLEHFYLIDAHKGGPGDPADDLAALDAPAPAFFRRTERLRFFLRYRQHDRLTDADKQLLRQVLAAAGPMRDRQLRRVREARR